MVHSIWDSRTESKEFEDLKRIILNPYTFKYFSHAQKKGLCSTDLFDFKTNHNYSLHPVLLSHLFNQLIAFLSHIPRLGEISPYTDGIGKCRIISGKAFDGQPAFVLNICQCFERLLKVYMA